MELPSADPAAEPIRIIVACDRGRGIGKGGRLPWSLPGEWRHFLDTTRDGVLVLGRRCFEEMVAAGQVGNGRRMVVLTRDGSLADPARDVRVAGSLAEAREEVARWGGPLWIGGGQRLYEEALPLAAELWLTRIDAAFEVDTWFPDWTPWFDDGMTLAEREEQGLRYRITRHLRR